MSLCAYNDNEKTTILNTSYYNMYIKASNIIILVHLLIKLFLIDRWKCNASIRCITKIFHIESILLGWRICYVVFFWWSNELKFIFKLFDYMKYTFFITQTVLFRNKPLSYFTDKRTRHKSKLSRFENRR